MSLSRSCFAVLPFFQKIGFSPANSLATSPDVGCCVVNECVAERQRVTNRIFAPLRPRFCASISYGNSNGKARHIQPSCSNTVTVADSNAQRVAFDNSFGFDLGSLGIGAEWDTISRNFVSSKPLSDEIANVEDETAHEVEEEIDISQSALAEEDKDAVDDKSVPPVMKRTLKFMEIAEAPKPTGPKDLNIVMQEEYYDPGMDYTLIEEDEEEEDPSSSDKGLVCGIRPSGQRLTNSQVQMMETAFILSRTPTEEEAKELSLTTGLSVSQVVEWTRKKCLMSDLGFSVFQDNLLNNKFFLDRRPPLEEIEMLSYKGRMDYNKVTQWFQRMRLLSVLSVPDKPSPEQSHALEQFFSHSQTHSKKHNDEGAPVAKESKRRKSVLENGTGDQQKTVKATGKKSLQSQQRKALAEGFGAGAKANSNKKKPSSPKSKSEQQPLVGSSGNAPVEEDDAPRKRGRPRKVIVAAC